MELFAKLVRIKNMSNTDNEVIIQILDGDTELFRLLVDRHKIALYRHCFYITHDEDAADDMAQEAFIKSYMKLGQYDTGKASYKTWLFTIATRLCVDYLRSQKNKSLPILLDEAWTDTTIDLPSVSAEKAELYQQVLNLKPKYRTATMLYYWHGYSYEEIAQYMNVPLGTIRSLLHRAKQQLKEALS